MTDTRIHERRELLLGALESLSLRYREAAEPFLRELAFLKSIETPKIYTSVDWATARCEVCGAQVAVQVFDLIEFEDAATGLRRVRHHGGPHLFCDEHKRESRRTKIGPMWPPPS